MAAKNTAGKARQAAEGAWNSPYAQRLAQDPKGPSSFSLAATLAGSGGLGISVGMSARAVIQGVRAANELGPLFVKACRGGYAEPGLGSASGEPARRRPRSRLKDTASHPSLGGECPHA